MIKKPDFKDVKCELIKTEASIGKVDHIFPKLTEENFSIFADKINELINVVNDLKDRVENIEDNEVHHGWDED